MKSTQLLAVFGALAVAGAAAGCLGGGGRKPGDKPDDPCGACDSLDAIREVAPGSAEQPLRERPSRVIFDMAGERAYVSMGGSVGKPGTTVAVLDPATGAVTARLEVGYGPAEMALHPGGRFIVVLNRYSNYASVIDTTKRKVSGYALTDYYCEGIAFSADGRQAFVTNRKRDAVLIFDVETTGATFRMTAVTSAGGDGGVGMGSSPLIGSRSQGVLAPVQDQTAFNNFVWPIMKQVGEGNTGPGCMGGACHSGVAGRMNLGALPNGDMQRAYDEVKQRSLDMQPDASALLTKASRNGGTAHAGGTRWAVGSTQYTTVRQWMNGTLEVGGGGDGGVLPGDGGVVVTDGGLVADATVGPKIELKELEVGQNPRDIAVSASGKYVFVGELGGLGISVIDVAKAKTAFHLDTNSMVLDVAAVGDLLLVATTNSSNGLPCKADPEYVALGAATSDDVFADVADQTCTRGYSDIQNELALWEISKLTEAGPNPPAVRYTSDTAEKSEADFEGELPRELQIVQGSLPEQIAVRGTDVWIAMSASREVAQYELVTAPPGLRFKRVLTTGWNPTGVAIAPSGKVMVTNRLSDVVSIIDPVQLAAAEMANAARSAEERRLAVEATIQQVAVGSDRGRYPRTAVEIGESYYYSTALFASDGDKSCNHCHYELNSDGKAWGIGLVTKFGRRSVMPAWNQARTAPYLAEGAIDMLDGLRPKVEEISLRIDYTGASIFGQLMTRDIKYQELSYQLYGEQLTFDQLIANMVAFLGNDAHLPPNPNKFSASDAVLAKGKQIFTANCVTCHDPGYTYTKPSALGPVVTLGRYDDFNRDESDPNILGELLAKPGFVFNPPSLRGLWDRPGPFLHDGRARTVREVLLPPGSMCLKSSERGWNETKTGGAGGSSIPGTHAPITELPCADVDALVKYLWTL